VHRDDAEQIRHTPSDLAGAIAMSGLYPMFVLASPGGSEPPPLAAFHAIEEVA
jgi:indole-3-acetate monooxygenase